MTKSTQTPTPAGFTPPASKCSYVAYQATPERIGNPDTGEAIDLRPSVFIREFPSVLVSRITRKVHREGTKDQFETASVTFDAASVKVDGFTKDFGASVQVGGPVLSTLEEAHKRGAPVYVAIETARKARPRGGTYDAAAYIHDLRGAKADGSGGNANTTEENCWNVVVGCGPAGAGPEYIVFAGDLRSDPAEWESLRRNRDHTLPPAGWRIDRGGITPSATAAASGGGNVDVQALAHTIAEQVRATLAPAFQGAPSRVRPPQREQYAQEAKPWEPWNTDGRVNLSSYGITKDRYTFAEAVALLTDDTGEPAITGDGDAFLNTAWALADTLLLMADHVQAQVSGHRPNRDQGSHKEAARWCSTVYTDLPPSFGTRFTPEVAAGPETMQAWAEKVIPVAARLFARSAERVTATLVGDTPTPAPQGHSVATQGPPPAQQAPQGDPQGQGMVTDNHGMVAAWEGLLASVGQAEHPERFTHLLIETFGQGVLSRIPADAFAAHLSTWQANSRGFSQAAYEAHMRAMTAGSPT